LIVAVDTSVVVAAFASWHEGHRSAVQALARAPRVPAHVLFETYSVLTRLPPPHRAPPGIVAAFLAERFPEAPLTLPPRAYPRLIAQAAKAEVTGGSLYDALVAATVARARARLLTRDRRAVPTYERLGIEYELLS
jgi:predicted nucleic acid-binding protein